MSGTYPSRCVLEGVPKVGYHKHLCPFPGSVFACLEYLRTPFTYEYLMGVTGAAFRRLWEKDDGGNVDLMYFAPEPYLRAFRAIGYECIQIPGTDRAAVVDAVKASTAAGKPLIAFGIIGPPEAGIVAGYDHDGDVLLGYSCFQEGEGYYQQEGWLEGIEPGSPIFMLAFGDRAERPAERETLVSTLRWTMDLARTKTCVWDPNAPEHLNGLAAYEGWASGFEVDEDYPAGNREILGVRVMVHGDQTVMLHDRRPGAAYLRSMTDVAPGAADELLTAASLYDQVADTPGIWMWGHEMGEDVQDALAGRETRLGIAAQIRRAGETEAQAVAHVEAALELLT